MRVISSVVCPEVSSCFREPCLPRVDRSSLRQGRVGNTTPGLPELPNVVTGRCCFVLGERAGCVGKEK